jgi:Z1 domain/TOBE domain
LEPYEIAFTLMESELRAGAGLAAAKQKALGLIRNPEAVDRAAREIAKLFKIIEELEPAPVSTESGSRWYTGPKLSDVYWPAYRDRLRATGWTDAMLEALDRTTTRVVSQLEAPGNPEIDTKGLVIGRVQSGKTANFTGVIAKAADCNYRFFIILSGTTKMLRLQTQKRIERDLTNNTPGKWVWLTRRDISGDFGDNPPGNINVTLGNRSVRTIAVVKKNSAVLRRLIDWIAGGTDILKRDCPVIVVDDEADQASIPTGRSLSLDDLNTINRRIVELISVTPKIAYVGYTATPFANVLIDPNYEKNLYPRSFIYSLPTPPDYFGPERIFGRDPLNDVEGESVSEGLPLIRTVLNDEIPLLRPMSRAEVQTFRFEVTPSLDEALRYFYMATAARLFREKNSGVEMDFSTCLIHTSERVLAHKRAKEAIDLHKTSCIEEVRRGGLDSWRSLWDGEMNAIDRERLGSRLSKVRFEDLSRYLFQAIDHCDVLVSNSNQNKETNVTFEKKGQIAIIIGGNTLARGLMLDEPLSALDKNLRASMQVELREIQRRLGLTTLFVTHDQGEALSLSDRVAVMSDGEVRQVGTPSEIYVAPRERFVASFVGDVNILRGHFERIDGAHAIISMGSATVRMRRQSFSEIASSMPVDIFVRPEQIQIAELIDTTSLPAATVSAQIYQGGHVDLYLESADSVSGPLLVRVSGDDSLERWPVGKRVGILFSTGSPVVFRTT